jgi:deoxyhypusine synthase
MHIMLQNSKELINLINMCREEKEIGKRCQFLGYINYLMPADIRVTIPSIITHDCIDAILSSMEERLSPPIYELTS